MLGFFDSSYVLTDERSKRWSFAEYRIMTERNFRLMRNRNLSTEVRDVQLEGGAWSSTTRVKSTTRFAIRATAAGNLGSLAQPGKRLGRGRATSGKWSGERLSVRRRDSIPGGCKTK